MEHIENFQPDTKFVTDEYPIQKITTEARKDNNVKLLSKLKVAREQDNNDQQIDIKSQIAENNLPLVIAIASSIVRKLDLDNSPSSLQALISAGIIGVIHAAEKFEDSKEAVFSTYATWWIRKYMQHELEGDANSGKVRVPTNLCAEIKQTIDKHTVEGTTDWLKVEQELMTTIDGKKKHTRIGEYMKQAIQIVAEHAESISLQDTMAESEADDSLPVIESIPDKHAISPEQAAMIAERLERIEETFKGLKGLDERTETMVRLRFGFPCSKFPGHEGTEMFPEDIGKLFELSRTSVYNILNAVKQKLAEHPGLKDLFDEME